MEKEQKKWQMKKKKSHIKWNKKTIHQTEKKGDNVWEEVKLKI